MNARTLKGLLALRPAAVASMVRRMTARAVTTSKSTPVSRHKTDGREWEVCAHGAAWGSIKSCYGSNRNPGIVTSYEVQPLIDGLEDFEILVRTGDTPRDTLTHARNLIRLLVQTSRGENTPEANALLNPAPSPVAPASAPEPVATPEAAPEEAPVGLPPELRRGIIQRVRDGYMGGFCDPNAEPEPVATPETLPGLEPSTVTCTPSEAERLREYAAEQTRRPHDPACDHATALGLTMAVFAGERPPSEAEWRAVMGGPYPGRFTRGAGKRVWVPEYGPYAPARVERQPDYPRPMSVQTEAVPEVDARGPRPYTGPESLPAAPPLVCTVDVELPLGFPPMAPEHRLEAAQSLAALLGASGRADLIAGFVEDLEGSEGSMIDTDREARALVIGAAWAAFEASRQAKTARPKGGRIPYGFKRLDTGGLGHCKEEREAAEEIARGRVNGESWGQISTRLNASRIPGSRSGEWTRSQVRNAWKVRRAWLDAAEATRT